MIQSYNCFCIGVSTSTEFFNDYEIEDVKKHFYVTAAGWFSLQCEKKITENTPRNRCKKCRAAYSNLK